MLVESFELGIPQEQMLHILWPVGHVWNWLKLHLQILLQEHKPQYCNIISYCPLWKTFSYFSTSQRFTPKRPPEKWFSPIWREKKFCFGLHLYFDEYFLPLWNFTIILKAEIQKCPLRDVLLPHFFVGHCDFGGSGGIFLCKIQRTGNVSKS